MKKITQKYAAMCARALKRMISAIVLMALMLGMASVLAYEAQPGNPYSGMLDE